MLSILAFEWMRGCGWRCFDSHLRAIRMHKNVINPWRCLRKSSEVSIKKGHHCPCFHSTSEQCFHSRGQHLCKFIGTKESVCVRKEFNSLRTCLGHQHGRRFIALGHQFDRRDVMWKHSILSTYWCNFPIQHTMQQLIFSTISTHTVVVRPRSVSP